MSNKLKVTVNSCIDVEVDPGQPQTLLEALEQAGLETRYHCRSGFCGACRTTLIKGEVKYINDPLAYMRPNEILPCVCKAATDLEIEH